MTKSALDTLLFELNHTEEVKQYKKLLTLINQDVLLKNKFARLTEVKKQATNAKYYNLTNAYSQYLNEYQKILAELDENVLWQMYKASEADVNELLELITRTIEREINDSINK